MKPLNFPTKKEESDYMRMRKAQNLAKAPSLKSESWFLAYIADRLPVDRRFKFSRQASWGYRLLMFRTVDFHGNAKLREPEVEHNWERYAEVWERYLRAEVATEPDPEKRFAQWLAGLEPESMGRAPMLLFYEEPWLTYANLVRKIAADCELYGKREAIAAIERDISGEE